MSVFATLLMPNYLGDAEFPASRVSRTNHRRCGRACSEFAVRAVAKRRAAGGLAAAKEHLFADIGRVFHWREALVLVGPITEGLLGGMTAGAPEVGFSFLNLDGGRPLLSYFWCIRHLVSFQKRAASALHALAAEISRDQARSVKRPQRS